MPMFRAGEAEVPWREIWERIEQSQGRAAQPHIREIIRYLAQREAVGEQDRPLVGRESWEQFERYFPEETLLDDVEWLNANRYFWIGASSDDVKSMMEKQENIYAGVAEEEPVQPRRFQHGDFVVRTSSRWSKLVVSYLDGNQVRHSIIYRNKKDELYPRADADHLVIGGLTETNRRTRFPEDGAGRPKRGLRALVQWVVEERISTRMQRPCGSVSHGPPPQPVRRVPSSTDGEPFGELRAGLATLVEAAAEGADLTGRQEEWESLRRRLQQQLTELRAGVAAHTSGARETRYALQDFYRRQAVKLVRSYYDQLHRLKEHSSWGLLAEEVAAGAAQFPGPIKQQLRDACPLVTLYEQAGRVKTQFCDWLRTVLPPEHAGAAKVVLCDKLKCPFRAVEKTVLSDGQGLCCVADVVRGMLAFEDAGSMLHGFRAVLASPVFKVTRVKNRIEHPTDAGWSDILINGHFRDDPNGHQCEVQLVFDTMSVVRHRLGGHHDYVTCRLACELLVASGYSPDVDMRSKDLSREAEAASERGDGREAAVLRKKADEMRGLLRQRQDVENELRERARSFYGDRNAISRTEQLYGRLKDLESETDRIEPRPWSTAPPLSLADMH
eukprot:TRINITY_DN40666_c0_g1_i1.p1 TRINITY_DN40666_c0_g1~~TRINITY_DN40666_c0_g1_i1.p1  ORF type:complete len:613 (+),score=125.59 TRINITY_DN40666_c0_g1_i1:133-1971(+)